MTKPIYLMIALLLSAMVLATLNAQSKMLNLEPTCLNKTRCSTNLMMWSLRMSARSYH